MKKFAILTVLIFLAGCCTPGDNACYKAWYGLIPDDSKASGYRTLSVGEYLFFGEKNIEKNQEKP